MSLFFRDIGPWTVVTRALAPVVLAVSVIGLAWAFPPDAHAQARPQAQAPAPAGAGAPNAAGPASAESSDYALAAGDTVRIQVFQNPDLTLETRVNEGGSISFPLIGQVDVAGLSAPQVEKKIAEGLEKGGFVRNPQVTVVVLQLRGNQVAVLGQVNRPGRYALETANVRLLEMLALAGGATPAGDDVVIVTGARNGQPFRRTVDIAALFVDQKAQDNFVVQGGDMLYVHRAPVYYIYGEAQRPGAYRLERGMTVMQALALGGGPTQRGTDKRLLLHRKAADGPVQSSEPRLTDPVQPNDVIYVRESLF